MKFLKPSMAITTFGLLAGLVHAQDTVFVDPNGSVGIGTASPAAPLHLTRSDSNARIVVENTNLGSGPQTLVELKNDGPTKIFLTNTAADTWIMNAANDGYRITAKGQPLIAATFDKFGNLYLGGTVQSTSDRERKEDFTEIDPTEILDKIAHLPVTSWRYKDDQPDARHVGPTGQDFFAAFGLGSNERYISSSDLAGVALAAIKGLDAQLRDLASDLELLRRENAALRQR